MERRHLGGATALAAATLVAAAAAATGLQWRLVSGGAAVGAEEPTMLAYVALNRASVQQFASRLPARALTKVGGVDFKRDLLVAVFGDFGCEDALIDVASVQQRRTTLAVTLVKKPPKPGTATCMAIFATYRLLALPKTALRSPYPTRATVTLVA